MGKTVHKMITHHAHDGDAIAAFRNVSNSSTMAGVTTIRRRCHTCNYHKQTRGGRLKPKFKCADCIAKETEKTARKAVF